MSEVVAAPTLRPIITNKGLEAAIQASTLGKTCEITHVGIGSLAGTGHEEDVVLAGEQFRVPVADGKTVNQFQVNVAALITDTHPSITIHGIGFYLADGTLFAVYQTESVLMYHTTGSSLLVGMDVVMSNIPAGSIVVESTGANLVLGDFVPQERTVNGKELRKDIVLTAEDVGAMPLGSGGGDRIGSVVTMMAVQDHLVHDDDKVYLKEGVTLEDAANVFPEAFEKLSGAKGKQFLISTAGRGAITGTPQGFATRGDRAMIITNSSTQTNVYLVNPKDRVITRRTGYESASKSNFVEYAGKMFGSMESNKFLVFDIADHSQHQEASSPVGNWGTSNMTLGCATKGGILWSTGATGELAFMSIADNGAIKDIVKYKLTGANTSFVSVMSFTDKTGNKVNFAVTGMGEIFWKAGDDHSTNAGWVKKWSTNAAELEPDLAVTYGVYSVEADAVYFADAYGLYAVCDPRMSPLNEAGDVALLGAFMGEYEQGLTWSQIGDTIFANPINQTATDSPNAYYRLDPKTAKWDSFKHGVNVKLGVIARSVGGIKCGEHMVAVGSLVTGGSNSYIMMISSPAVHLQSDPTTKGGVANYVRIK